MTPALTLRPPEAGDLPTLFEQQHPGAAAEIPGIEAATLLAPAIAARSG